MGRLHTSVIAGHGVPERAEGFADSKFLVSAVDAGVAAWAVSATLLDGPRDQTYELAMIGKLRPDQGC
jgi:hypothetical protein